VNYLLTQLLVAVIGIVVICCVWASRREIIARANRATALMFAAVVLPSAANAVGILTHTRFVTASSVSYERTVILSDAAASTVRVASPLLLGIALVLVLSRLRRDTAVNPAPLIFAAIVGLAALVDGLNVTGAQWTYLTLLVAAALLPAGAGARLGVALGILAVVAASAISVWLDPDTTLVSCDLTGCNQVNVSGVADNGNSLGLMLALGLPFLLFGLPKFQRTTAVVVAGMILLSTSETAVVATAALAFVYLVCRPNQDGAPTTSARLLPLMGGGAFVAQVVVPQLDYARTAFTGRPVLWDLALNLVSDRPLLGWGTYTWRGLADRGIIARAAGYSTHNQFLEALFVNGAVGLLLLLGFLVALVVRGGVRTWWYLIPAAVVGIAERPWSLGQIDWLTWSVIGLCLAVEPARRTDALRAQPRDISDVTTPAAAAATSASGSGTPPAPRPAGPSSPKP
jgi:O-antigen ligase